MKQTQTSEAGERTQENILTCKGAGCRQAFILGRVEIGRGATDQEAIQNLLGKIVAPAGKD